MKRLLSVIRRKMLSCQTATALCLLWPYLLATPVAHADQTLITGGILPSTLTATAKLNFNIAIAKYVMLQVGNADATLSAVTFTVGISPVIATGNSRSYTGTTPPGFATTVASTNPTGTTGTLTVAAYTNVNGTTLTCSLTPLAGAIAFAAGATAGGVPGTNDITVTSGTSGSVQHPGTSLASCNGTTTTLITSLTAMSGTFTYGTNFTANSVAVGTYGNIVIYTATTL